MLPLAADPQDDPCTDNEGESTDAEEEAPADQSLRGQTCLVTAACPRQYPRELEARRAQRLMIPEDFGKEEFLTKFRRTLAKHSTVKLEKASCHSEPHKRISRTTRKRVRHYHLALKLSGNFAHKKVADAFYKEHGLRITFSFKSNRFVGNLAYLMDAGKKASTNLDLDPSVFPRVLHLKEELKARKHPDRPWHVPVTVDKDHTNTLPRAKGKIITFTKLYPETRSSSRTRARTHKHIAPPCRLARAALLTFTFPPALPPCRLGRSRAFAARTVLP
jgi:hypothetical protein